MSYYNVVILRLLYSCSLLRKVPCHLLKLLIFFMFRLKMLGLEMLRGLIYICNIYDAVCGYWCLTLKTNIYLQVVCLHIVVHVHASFIMM